MPCGTAEGSAAISPVPTTNLERLTLPPRKLECGPVVIDGADLIVDQASGERGLTDVVLVKVDVVFTVAFWMNDPGRGLFRHPEDEEINGGGEIFGGADEAERQIGLRGELSLKDRVLRYLVEQIFKANGGGQQGDPHVVADAQLLWQSCS